MKRFVILVLALVGIVLPTDARAGTPYSINFAWTQENPACETAHLVHQGVALFQVNQTPIPTYEVPDAFSTNENGWESNIAQAGFDSVLLHMGANNFKFDAFNAYGNNSCVHSSNVVTLVSAPLGIEKLLFNVRRDGAAFSGSTHLDLKLEEINPQLAQDIAILEAEIAEERKWLVKNAREIVDLDKRLDALQALETELGDLLTRPLDEITADDLDEILNRYASVVDDATRAALQQVLADLKKSLDDLQSELASLMANFGDQADSVADLITGDARQNGFTPDDPSHYALGPNDVPWPEVPDISNIPGAFDRANDPYAAYADGVIASLQENVNGAIVVGRANFVATVRAWRSNQAALHDAILARMSVSQAETNAFLKAEIKVTDYLRRFMNGSGWFHDAPIPEDVRAQVDGPLKAMYGAMAEDLKDRLNAWEVAHSPPEANLFFDTLRAFSAGMQEVEDGAQRGAEVMRTFVHAATRVGIGFVPFVGPALDLCEAVTGREWCTPSGRELTTGERVWSATGFGVGKLVRVWRGVRKAPISAQGKIAAEGIVNLGEEVAEALATSRIQKWKTLERASMNLSLTKKFDSDFEKKVILHLIKDKQHKMLAMGDGVSDILRLKGEPLDASFKIPDFLSVSPQGGLVVSEAKFFDFNKENAIPAQWAVEQLKSAMNRLVQKSVAQDVERVQLVMPKGAKLADGIIKNPDGSIKEIWTFTAKDGYLLKNGQTVTMPGKPNLFVRILEL